MLSNQGCLLLIGAFLILLASVATAQCTNKPFAPCKQYDTADSVFIGGVKEISYSEPFDEGVEISRKRLRKKLIQFEIKEPFKNIAEKQTAITIATTQFEKRSRSGELTFENYFYEDCPFYEFAENEIYLVYPHRGKSNKEFIVLTGQAKPVSQADDEITYLRDLKVGKNLAVLYGKIVRKVRQLGYAYPETIERPIRSITIEIQSDKQTFTATTDDKGAYLFLGIPPDEYLIKCDLPEDLVVEDKAKKISLTTGACLEKNIVALSTGQISGTIFSETGEPRMGITVELVVASEANKPNPRVFEARSDNQSGKFEFKNLPASQYFLGFGLIKSRPNPYIREPVRPRTYYPGVANISQAALISLAEGEQLKDFDFRLLPPLTERTISGVVMGADDKPVANADIVLMISQYEFNESGGIGKTDGYGRFSLNAFNDLKYWINANSKIKGEDKHSEPIELPKNGDVNEIRLIISSSGKFCSLCYNKYWKRKGAPPK